MKNFIFLILSCFLFAQARVGEMRSITSSLEVRDIISVENNLFLATSGGLAKYNIDLNKYIVFTKDNGLYDTDIFKVHIGPKGLIWIGSKISIQIWDFRKKIVIEYFDLDLEEVVGFTNYKNMIYGAVKNNGVWGIIEFIEVNEKFYYRDFYGLDNIDIIKNIITFGEKVFIQTNNGLLAGNPHKEHPLFWKDPYPILSENLLALDVKEDILALVTKNGIYSIILGETPFALVKQDSRINSIDYVLIQNEQEFLAISDSVVFKIGNDILNVKYVNPKFRFNLITSLQSKVWLGTNLGLGEIHESHFKHVAGNEPIVMSPKTIKHLGNDQWIMADEKGISLKGWYNLTSKSFSSNLSSNLNLVQASFDLGESITQIIYQNNKVYAGLKNSISGGIASFDFSNGLKLEQIFYPKQFFDVNNQKYNISSIIFDKKNNLWAISNNLNEPISIFKDKKSRDITIIESGGLLSQELQTITVDNFNRIWIGENANLIMYKYSGDIIAPTSELWLKVDIDPGITSRKVFHMNISTKNRLWILTNIGLIYKDLQAEETNPIVETGPLIQNRVLRPFFPNISFNKSSRIRFDPRGNIWVTSQSDGVYILTEDGEYWPDINGVNTSNSLILSNSVNDVTFDSEEGLAYIATNKGVSVLRIPYSIKKKSYNSVEIFPSPYRIPNDKPLTISGLMDYSSIKIMNLNGLVLRSISQNKIKGYQAFWDGRDDKGRLVGSGVYLISVYNKKGESSIEKVAVIRR